MRKVLSYVVLTAAILGLSPDLSNAGDGSYLLDKTRCPAMSRPCHGESSRLPVHHDPDESAQLNCVSASQWCPAWTSSRPMGRGSSDPGTHAGLLTLGDPKRGRVYEVGISQGSATDFDIVAIGIDAATGRTRWSTRLDGGRSLYDEPLDAILSRDARTLIVTGVTERASNEEQDEAAFDMVTVALDTASGDPIWTSIHEDLNGRITVGSSLIQDPVSQIVYVGGETSGGPSERNRDFQLLANDMTSGKELWSRRVAERWQSRWEVTELAAAAVDGATLLVLTGAAQRPNCKTPQCNPHFESAYLTVAFRIEGKAPNLLWKRVHDQPDDAEEPMAVLVDDRSNQVFVIGRSLSHSESPCTTIAYDLITGRQLWISSLEGEGQTPVAKPWSTPCWDATLAPDGKRIYITGAADQCQYDSYCWLVERDVFAAAIDAGSGRTLWKSTFPSMSDDVAWAMALTKDRLFLAGQSGRPTATAMLLMAIDPHTGSVLDEVRLVGTTSTNGSLADLAVIERKGQASLVATGWLSYSDSDGPDSDQFLSRTEFISVGFDPAADPGP